MNHSSGWFTDFDDPMTGYAISPASPFYALLKEASDKEQWHCHQFIDSYPEKKSHFPTSTDLPKKPTIVPHFQSNTF